MNNRQIIFAAVLVAIAGAASAQQQPSPIEQALTNKLLSEITATLQCSAASLTMQRELDAARQTIARLQAEGDKKDK